MTVDEIAIIKRIVRGIEARQDTVARINLETKTLNEAQSKLNALNSRLATIDANLDADLALLKSL